MSLLPCIYCRRTDVPRTREHVLQAGFGASATLPTEVCAECNAAFSPIDKAFLEAVGFYHTGDRMLRALGLGRTVLADGTTVNARLRPDRLAEYPPQLYEVTPTEWKYLGPREEHFHQMLAELADPSSLAVKGEVVSGGEGVPRLTLLRSAPRTYLAQGSDAAIVEAFVTQLRTTGMSPDWTGNPMERSSSSTPPIKYDTSLALDPYCRAMAKVALNFVCYRMGADVALRPQFDRVRRYAREGEGHFADFVLPTLLNHDIQDSAAAFVTTDHHALFMMAADADDGRREAVFVVIRGKTVGRVDLTRGAPGLPKGTWLLSRFSEAERRVEDLTLPNDMPRAVLNPAVLGLEAIWPKEWS